MTEIATTDDFYNLVREVHGRHPTWRYGQTVFNCLYEVRPDLSEQVRATALDPFYKDGGGWVFEFTLWLEEHWNEAPPQATPEKVIEDFEGSV